MDLCILAVVYGLCIIAMWRQVVLSRRQMKRAQHEAAQYREMLREAHDFIFFMGSARGQLSGEIEAIERAIADEQGRMVGKSRTN